MIDSSIPAGWFIKAVNLEAPADAAAPDIVNNSFVWVGLRPVSNGVSERDEFS